MPELQILNHDEERLALWQAINNVLYGNKTDDKLILEQLHKLGCAVVRVPGLIQAIRDKDMPNTVGSHEAG